MSRTALRFAWEQSRTTGGARLLLVALADFADDDGLCWPSLAMLARRTRLSRRHIIRLIPSLIELGELSVERRGHIGRSSLYRLPVAGRGDREATGRGDICTRQEGDIDAQGSDTKDTPGVTSAPGGVTSAHRGGDIAASPEVPIETPIEPSREETGREGATAHSRTRTSGAALPPALPPPGVVVKKKNNNNSDNGLPDPRPDPVALYRTLLRRTPNSPQVQLIRASVERNEVALARWRETLTAWAAHGYNPANVAGLLDVYAHGFQERSGRARGRARPGGLSRPALPAALPAAPAADPPLDPELLRAIRARRKATTGDW